MQVLNPEQFEVQLVLLLFIQVLLSLTTVDSAMNCLMLIMSTLFVALSVFPLRRPQWSEMFRVMAETSGNFGPIQMCFSSQTYSGPASVAFQRMSSQTKHWIIKAYFKTAQKQHRCTFNHNHYIEVIFGNGHPLGLLQVRKRFPLLKYRILYAVLTRPKAPFCVEFLP